MVSFKIVHKWNGHLEIFSRPQVIEDFLLRTDISQKTVVGCPYLLIKPPHQLSLSRSDSVLNFDIKKGRSRLHSSLKERQILAQKSKGWLQRLHKD